MKSRFSRFNAPAKPTASQGNPPMQDDPIKMVYPSQEDQNRLAKVEGNLTVAELLSQLNEALKVRERVLIIREHDFVYDVFVLK